MQTYAIMNLKGGVAKTVTTVNVAAILAHDHKKRVLVIDADSQANSTEFLTGGSLPENARGLADLLRIPQADRCTVNLSDLALQAIHATTVPGVELIPADDTLMDLDLSRAESGSLYLNCLADLSGFPLFKRYDYVLIDCPPAFNAAAAAALLSADQVLIPIKLDAFSLRGMTNILHQVEAMKRINPKLRLAGLLPTMWYPGEEILSAEKILRGSGLPVFPHIRRSNKVDDMTFRQEPLIKSSPKSGACKDYRFFVRYLEGGVRRA